MAGSPHTHYQILGVKEDATLEEIRAAYRHLSRLNHPDSVDQSTNQAEWQRRNQVAADLNEAHRVLRDEVLRRRYDEALRRSRPPAAEQPPREPVEPVRASAAREKPPSPSSARPEPRTDRARPGSRGPDVASERTPRRKAVSCLIRDLDPQRLARVREALGSDGDAWLVLRADRSASILVPRIGSLIVGVLLFGASSGTLSLLGLMVALFGLLASLSGLLQLAMPPIRPCIAVTRTRLVVVDLFRIRAWPLEELDAKQVDVSFGIRYPAVVSVDACGLKARCETSDLDGARNLVGTVRERSEGVRMLMRLYPSKVTRDDEFAGM